MNTCKNDQDSHKHSDNRIRQEYNGSKAEEVQDKLVSKSNQWK